jgi:hypothetical protein
MRCKSYEETGDWWICIKRSFVICTDHEIYSADQKKKKRDERTGLVGGMGVGRDRAVICVET